MTKPNANMDSVVRENENLLDQNFWNERWTACDTGWDIGYASPAIVNFMEHFSNKDVSILIPGCGNAYEAEFLIQKGFKNITLIDIAPKAVEVLKEKFKHEQHVKVLCEDFFHHHQKYDVIIEQTFFCAIDPSQRKNYASHCATLLQDGGQIIGLLFDKEFDKPGPPFGGCAADYKAIFELHFDIETMKACEDSIPQRKNSEIFIHLSKKK